jgi:hypothetical protein
VLNSRPEYTSKNPCEHITAERQQGRPRPGSLFAGKLIASHEAAETSGKSDVACKGQSFLWLLLGSDTNAENIFVVNRELFPMNDLEPAFESLAYVFLGTRIGTSIESPQYASG